MRQHKGFTIIELLVVVAIIGMLSAIAITSLNSARVKSRDARRVGDVREFRKALEFYNNENSGRYPAAPASPYYLANVVGIAPIYMPALPHDPSVLTPGTGNDYLYYTNATRSSGYSIAIFPEKTGAWCRYTNGGIVPAAWSAYPLCEQI